MERKKEREKERKKEKTKMYIVLVGTCKVVFILKM